MAGVHAYLVLRESDISGSLTVRGAGLE
jgi:hypothetical protein